VKRPPISSSTEGVAGAWRLWVDTGGTFTDCLAVDDIGRFHRAKVLSSGSLRGRVVRWGDRRRLLIEADWLPAAQAVRGAVFRVLGHSSDGARIERLDPESGWLELASSETHEDPEAATFEISFGEEAPIVAARIITRTPLAEPLPRISMRLATTRGTNALLERTGEAPVLFITRGFRDLLRIGDQRRPDLFALEIERPPALFRTVVEVSGRIAADGTELEPLDTDVLEPVVRQLVSRGHRSAAVGLLNSYVDPTHEERLAELLRGAGFDHVSVSSSLTSSIRLLHRSETAVVDAYLAPVLTRYLEAVGSALVDAAVPEPDGARGRLHVMTSAGGLVRAADFRPKDSLLSGPAGGVVGAARAGRDAGFTRIIAFDMGGTSTDVARVDGDFEYVWEHEVGGARLVAPALAIESVAAGGGSICAADDQGLRVGPESAGADPGPACYGAGGPLTLTDANLLLGRLKPSRFGIPLDVSAAGAAAEELRSRVVAGSDSEAVAEAPLLEGLTALADERMADAIREISLRKGYDPSEYALVAFGGAGPQHACGVAERLGIDSVVVPPDAGLLSAMGIGHAVIERFAERQFLRRLVEIEPEIAAVFRELEAQAIAAVEAEGEIGSAVQTRRRIASLRFEGQEATLEIDWNGRPLTDSFLARYTEVYGHLPEDRPIELVSVRVVASTTVSERGRFERPVTTTRPAVGESSRTWLGGRWADLPCYERSELRPGDLFSGPALVWERHSATLVGECWEAEVHPSGALLLRRTAVPESVTDSPVVPDLVREELFIHRFRSIVAEMGEQLRRTALSVNVRERLDFSCALLDPEGRLVVNAPHIPVHLGALGMCVRHVASSMRLGPGDVVMTNHPAAGGSHLPDVTVLAPVHDGAGVLIGYVANRAHHAEIGGVRPGSMPPGATTLAEEGVVIPPTLLVRAGVADWTEAESLLRGGPYPSRAVAENLADLRAQVAAVSRGVALLRELADRNESVRLLEHMHALTDRAERRVRTALLRIPDGSYTAMERLDDGWPLAVRIEVEEDRAMIDFGGSGGVHPGNLNCTPAIVRSVVLYVVRLLTDEPIPLNEGLLGAIEIRVPEGLLNPAFGADPRVAPAVVGGNVETSQRLVDTCLRALRLAACSQGTMNNVLFGNERFGYYETVCGGSGAGPGWTGADAVHTHMTNTRITDPEVLEHRYPVRVERFGIRRGSGGAGQWKGGDGAVREIRFLEPLSLSVLTQHRVEAPFGMDGGASGSPGRQWVERSSGDTVVLASVDGCEVLPGDRLVLETPGGGGWGPAR
jgi:5-oxoprolinase (ATP-hydrolysing)